MTTTGTSARLRSTAPSRVRRPAVLALAAGQLVAAVVLAGAGGQPGGSGGPGGPGGPALLITPAPWASSIWGLVVAGCLGYGVYQVSPRRGDALACAAVGWPLVGVQAGFVAWLVLSATAPSWTTVVVLLVMVGLLTVASTRALAARRSLPLLPRQLLLATLGLYTGWSAVALVLDAGAALLAAGLPATGGGALAWQLVALLVVVAVGAAVVLRWRARLSSTAAVVWALAGSAAGAADAGSPLLAGLAVAAALGTAGWAAWLRWSDLRTRAEAVLDQAQGRTTGRTGAPGVGRPEHPGGHGITVAGTVVDPDGREQPAQDGSARAATRWPGRRRR